jgi:hypothetical protein
MPSDILGPVDCIAVEFPDGVVTGLGFRLVTKMVRAGTIRVLDLQFIARAEDGSVSRVALKDIEHGGDTDITVWDGAASGLLDDSDFAQVAASISPGSLAGILVFENTWAVPLLTALDESTARLIGWERIGVTDLVAALG